LTRGYNAESFGYQAKAAWGCRTPKRAAHGSPKGVETRE
jgi:hypothetical protein